MKNILILLLCCFLASSVSHARSTGQKPPYKTKHAFKHLSESSKGKNSRARFRPANPDRPTIDLTPGKLEKFKTAKAGKNWKFSNGKGFKPQK
jgi:hypothetical protein